jgi:hypothetical protein
LSVALGEIVGPAFARHLPGCAVSRTEEDAIRRAWEGRDAERARAGTSTALSADFRA